MVGDVVMGEIHVHHLSYINCGCKSRIEIFLRLAHEALNDFFSTIDHKIRHR